MSEILVLNLIMRNFKNFLCNLRLLKQTLNNIKSVFEIWNVDLQLKTEVLLQEIILTVVNKECCKYNKIQLPVSFCVIISFALFRMVHHFSCVYFFVSEKCF